jgi:hypothetical protein
MTVKIWGASSGECLRTFNIARAPDRISFDVSDSYIHTGIDIIDLRIPAGSSPPPSPSNFQSPQYQGPALSADGIWITYDSENLVWLPLEYRPSCSAVSRNTIGIGVGMGRVWICNVELNIS